MYPNLIIEMKRKGIMQKELAQKLVMREAKLSLKINGKYDFWLNECVRIQSILGKDMTIDYLFQKTEKA